MSTENKSPSYLEDREEARRWLTQTKEGRMAADFLKQSTLDLDDDKFIDWEDVIRETKDHHMIASNCKDAREAFELARQSSSIMAAPLGGKDAWRKIFSPPTGYVLRRPIETADPYYWNDPKNIYREALAHPEWCCVSADYIRGSMEQYLPKGRD